MKFLTRLILAAALPVLAGCGAAVRERVSPPTTQDIFEIPYYFIPEGELV